MRSALVVAGALVGLFLPATPAGAQPTCGDAITSDTTLTADLNCPSDGIVIGAPGITLDLGGHTIRANYGVRDDGFDDVTIRNGRVAVDTIGIGFRGVSGSTIRDVDFYDFQRAVELRDSDGNRILDNSFASVWLSLLEGSDRNVVRGNTVRGYEGFISVRDSSDNRIVENDIDSGLEVTVGLTRSHRNRVARNTLKTSSNDVVLLWAANDNEVVGNAIALKPSFGPDLTGGVKVDAGSSRNRLVRNAFAATPIGGWVVSGSDNVLQRNSASGGDGDGFLVEAAASGTRLERNVSVWFGDDGIDVDAPGTFIARNRADDNGDLGIEAVAGVVDGGGNRARGNANPFQCVNVFCR
jgi:parallel beta-helix repeat protein